jgi:hypothetical protein
MTQPGQGVDSKGQPVIDPTKNVLDLVRAETKRQDDLREMEAAHVRELMERDRVYFERMRVIETARLDAIRAVDVNAVQRATEVANQQATTLAAGQAAQADAVRVTLATALEPIQKAIEELRKSQYELAGQRAQVVETRDVRGDQRLNLNTVLIMVTVAIAIATFVLTKG